MEDYALFARMLQGGARAVNVAEPLVYYRVGAKAFKRRGGTGLLRSELRLQRDFLRCGFITPAEYLRNVAVRGGYRLIPWWLPPGGVPPAGRAAQQPPGAGTGAGPGGRDPRTGARAGMGVRAVLGRRVLA
jgi:hypothetical protein